MGEFRLIVEVCHDRPGRQGPTLVHRFRLTLTTDRFGTRELRSSPALSPQPVDEGVHSCGVRGRVVGNCLVGGRKVEKARKVHVS